VTDSVVQVFSEDGERVLVQVLGMSMRDDGLQVWNLKAIRTLRRWHRIGIADGQEFEVTVRPGYEAYVSWSLGNPVPEDLVERTA
jgi:hypothetical protein